MDSVKNPQKSDVSKDAVLTKKKTTRKASSGPKKKKSGMQYVVLRNKNIGKQPPKKEKKEAEDFVKKDIAAGGVTEDNTQSSEVQKNTMVAENTYAQEALKEIKGETLEIKDNVNTDESDTTSEEESSDAGESIPEQTNLKEESQEKDTEEDSSGGQTFYKPSENRDYFDLGQFSRFKPENDNENDEKSGDLEDKNDSENDIAGGKNADESGKKTAISDDEPVGESDKKPVSSDDKPVGESDKKPETLGGKPDSENDNVGELDKTQPEVIIKNIVAEKALSDTTTSNQEVDVPETPEEEPVPTTVLTSEEIRMGFNYDPKKIERELQKKKKLSFRKKLLTLFIYVVLMVVIVVTIGSLINKGSGEDENPNVVVSATFVAPDKLEYWLGDKIDLTGCKFVIKYANGRTEFINVKTEHIATSGNSVTLTKKVYDPANIGPIKFDDAVGEGSTIVTYCRSGYLSYGSSKIENDIFVKSGVHSVGIVYGNHTANFNVRVKETQMEDIIIGGYPNAYNHSEELIKNLIVWIKYSNGKPTELLSGKDYEFFKTEGTSFSIETVGNSQVIYNMTDENQTAIGIGIKYNGYLSYLYNIQLVLSDVVLSKGEVKEVQILNIPNGNFNAFKYYSSPAYYNASLLEYNPAEKTFKYDITEVLYNLKIQTLFKGHDETKVTGSFVQELYFSNGDILYDAIREYNQDTGKYEYYLVAKSTSGGYISFNENERMSYRIVIPGEVATAGTNNWAVNITTFGTSHVPYELYSPDNNNAKLKLYWTFSEFSGVSENVPVQIAYLFANEIHTASFNLTKVNDTVTGFEFANVNNLNIPNLYKGHEYTLSELFENAEIILNFTSGKQMSFTVKTYPIAGSDIYASWFMFVNGSGYDVLNTPSGYRDKIKFNDSANYYIYLRFTGSDTADYMDENCRLTVLVRP